MWKHSISGFLVFTKKERNGIFVLLFLVLFFIFLPFFYPYFIKQEIYDHTVFESAVAAIRLKQADSTGHFVKGNPAKDKYQHNNKTNAWSDNTNQNSGELFYFDPNSASKADWKRLGLRDKAINTIQNYLAKGGKFYNKEDIAKIWGLHEDELKLLIPYIRINIAVTENADVENRFGKKAYKKPVNTIEAVDINIADTTAFIALPGIGSKLSGRIINFRDKLGGFYSVEQVRETFGLPDSTFQKIKPWLKITNSPARRININTATIDEMKAHPYIRYALANAIAQYREQHGNYTAIEDIKKIMTVTEDIFNKLSPYLSVD